MTRERLSLRWQADPVRGKGSGDQANQGYGLKSNPDIFGSNAILER